MIHGYHLIFGAYGFWMPNDPRGSWSDFVGAWELFRYGPATKGVERKSQLTPKEKAMLKAAKESLQYPAVVFTDEQIECIARGFGHYVSTGKVFVWACSILGEHVHCVIARHHLKIEQIGRLLKGEATKQLIAEGLHPLQHYPKPDGTLPTPWGVGRWKTFLDSDEAIVNAIRYVEGNPEKEGRARQHWPFVVPFLGTEMGHGWITYH